MPPCGCGRWRPVADDRRAAKRFKKVENATAVIWKLLLLAERRFRRLNAPELLVEVWNGVQFDDGVRVPDRLQEAAA